MRNIRSNCLCVWILLLLLPALSSSCALAQAGTPSIESVGPTSNLDQNQDQDIGTAVIKQPAICGLAHLGQCLKDVGHDQAGIWTSPIHAQSHDLVWLLPLAGATAAALHYDVQAQQQLGLTPRIITKSSTVGAFGSPEAAFGEGAAFYALGLLTHHDHLAETGRLGAEAVLDASLVTEVVKLATNRDRPYQGNGNGDFWPHRTRDYSANGAFPSGHAAASWALARVIAEEYPNRWIRIGVYSFATAVSISRVTDGEHFPSDALVGSALGYLVGGYVFRHRSLNSDTPTVSFAPITNFSTKTFGLRINVLH
jgi:membrane-associated phospholipid phosphatase